ncbi:para-nitrobenzyl esterase PnbA [Bordetella genomosp. 1]|uniref:Carboxylic ester hydrolase n=2 Tax=Bordetella genomosp. 1 TaxID=1395607 RepID=A0A261SFS1_9BORD|nr:para-nitrobenzyl esterase PnbA [Bordetella genomosp. 1]
MPEQGFWRGNADIRLPAFAKPEHGAESGLRHGRLAGGNGRRRRAGPLARSLGKESVMRTIPAVLLSTLVSLSPFTFGPARAGSADAVQTEGGRIAGLAGTAGGVVAFRGIPYAAPPLGALRWRPPGPAPHWKGVRDGTRFGADCVQPAEYPELRGGGMSEDCLFLNVWTPAHRPQARLPVMVWFHGGGFRYGSGSHPSYDGAALAGRGAVVVTVNYRLGLLGFMAHPGLSAESPTHASGNYGLMDMLAALRWVQRNIAAFGGDPARVTVFGQSSGAHAISTMLVTPSSRGLYARAIMQSVGVMRPVASLAQAERFGELVGPDVAALRGLPAAELVARQKSLPRAAVLTEPALPGLTVDGALVPRPDYEAYAAGDYVHVPVLVGSNADEGGGAARKMAIATPAGLADYVARTFPGFEARAAQAYAAATDAEVKPVLSDLYGDLQFRYGTRALLRILARDGVPAWRYVYAHDRNGDGKLPVHGAELQFVFGTLAASHRGQHKPYGAADEQVSAAMGGAWTRFAASGDPNGAGLKGWRPVTPGQTPVHVFGKGPDRLDAQARARWDVIEDFYAAQRH